jgi:hypothetical protein
MMTARKRLERLEAHLLPEETSAPLAKLILPPKDTDPDRRYLCIDWYGHTRLPDMICESPYYEQYE